MLKTVVLFVWKYICFQDFLLNRKFKRTAFIIGKNVFFNCINVCTVTFDQFNASLLNKSINFFFKRKLNTDLKLLNMNTTS